MKKYVVTGGAGFIGSAIVRALVREGAGKVVVIDNFLTGKEENLDEVRGSIELHRADGCTVVPDIAAFVDDVRPKS